MQGATLRGVTLRSWSIRPPKRLCRIRRQLETRRVQTRRRVGSERMLGDRHNGVDEDGVRRNGAWQNWRRWRIRQTLRGINASTQQYSVAPHGFPQSATDIGALAEHFCQNMPDPLQHFFDGIQPVLRHHKRLHPGPADHSRPDSLRGFPWPVVPVRDAERSWPTFAFLACTAGRRLPTISTFARILTLGGQFRSEDSLTLDRAERSSAFAPTRIRSFKASC